MGFKVEEKFRIKTGTMASNSSFGNNGAFKIPLSVRTVHGFKKWRINKQKLSVKHQATKIQTEL